MTQVDIHKRFGPKGHAGGTFQRLPDVAHRQSLLAPAGTMRYVHHRVSAARSPGNSGRKTFARRGDLCGAERLAQAGRRSFAAMV